MTDNRLNDPDNPEWTEEDFRRARPASDVHSAAFAKAMIRTHTASGLSVGLEYQKHFARGMSLAA